MWVKLGLSMDVMGIRMLRVMRLWSSRCLGKGWVIPGGRSGHTDGGIELWKGLVDMFEFEMLSLRRGDVGCLRSLRDVRIYQR